MADLPRNSVEQYLASGVPLLRIANLTGVPYDEVCRRMDSVEIAEPMCRWMLQRDRIALYGQAIPDGMRLAWTCQVAYCGNPKHFALIETKIKGWRNYKDIRKRCEALQDGEWLDLPDEPNDEKSVLKFRAGLLGGSQIHFLVRTLPRAKGVRIIRSGDWYDGNQAFQSEHPLECLRRRPVKAPQECFYLGFLPCNRDDGFARLPRCNVRGCVYPAIYEKVCRYHVPELESPTFDRHLDQRDMIAPKEYPHLALTLYRDRIEKDHKGFLYATYVHDGAYTKTRYEQENDKWWQENVIEKGLITDADGVLHLIQSEKELNTVLGEEQSRENISRFFGLQTSGSGKMRLGGGRGKIRKKQRKRPAGWHGHRDDTKSNKPDRETIESESDWEYGSDHEEIEDDYSEEASA